MADDRLLQFLRRRKRVVPPPPPPGDGVQAMHSDKLVQFTGIAGHLNWGGTVWDQTAWRQKFIDTGCRWMRSQIGSNAVGRNHVNALYAMAPDYWITHISLMNTYIGTDGPGWAAGDGFIDVNTTNTVLDSQQNNILSGSGEGPPKIWLMEGANEYQHYAFGDAGWGARMRGFQEDLYAEIRSRVQWDAVRVGTSTVWEGDESAYVEAGSQYPNADLAVGHYYTGSRKPSLYNKDGAAPEEPISLAVSDIKRLLAPSTAKVVISETGYDCNTVEATSYTGEAPWGNNPNLTAASPNKASTNAISKYILRHILEFWRLRADVEAIVWYSLLDDSGSGNHFGLIASQNLVPRRQYWSLRNFNSLLKDITPTPYAAGQLPYTITTSGPDIKHDLVQKSNGRFGILIYNDVSSWNRSSPFGDINPARVAATINIDPSYPAFSAFHLYEPTILNTMTAASGLAIKGTGSGRTFALSVPDHVQYIECVP